MEKFTFSQSFVIVLVAFLPSFQCGMCNVLDFRKSSFPFINEQRMHNILHCVIDLCKIYSGLLPSFTSPQVT